MKTKNTIDNQIKSQLESREIPVSDDAWEKLSELMEEKPKERKIKSFLPFGIAASAAVLMGIFFGMNYFNDKPTTETENSSKIVLVKPEIVENKEAEKNVLGELTTVQNTEFTEKIASVNSEYSEKSNETPTTAIAKSESQEIQSENTEDYFEEKINEVVEPIKVEKEELVMALNTDSISKPKAKTNYVDPEMLLYSIENNQAVQQKNSGSRMVIIDFNK